LAGTVKISLSSWAKTCVPSRVYPNTSLPGCETLSNILSTVSRRVILQIPLP
jgi:hypothetical protein